MSTGPRGAPEPEELPPAPPSRSSLSLWVGLFLVLGLVAILGILFVMTEPAMFRGRYIITTRVPDAGGIRRGDPVRMRGVNIGRVQRFFISPEGVDVRLEIEGEYKIPKDSRVRLLSVGLLGQMLAEIIPGRSTEYLEDGDRLPGEAQEDLTTATNRLTEQVETVLNRVETLLSPETIRDVHGSTEELHRAIRQLSGAITEQRRELLALSGSLRRSSSSLEKAVAGPELERTVKRFDSLSQRMEAVTERIDRSSRSMETVMGRIERGEGTLGRLTKDDTLYDNLNQTTTSMNQTVQNLNRLTNDTRRLMEDIQKNPRRYFKFSVF